MHSLKGKVRRAVKIREPQNTMLWEFKTAVRSYTHTRTPGKFIILSMNSLDNDYFKAKYLNKCTLFGSVCVISIVFYIRRKCLYKITKICHICSSYDVIKADSGCIHDLERLCAHTEKYQ